MTEDYDYEEPTSGPKGEFIPKNEPSHESNRAEDNMAPGSKVVHHGMVIPLPLTCLQKRRVTEKPKECYLVLYEHFVIYKIVGKFEALDDATETWIPQKVNFRWTRMRKDLTDVAMHYDNDEKLYAVEMEFGKNVQTWFFEKGGDAKALYEILQNYFVIRDMKV